MMTMTTINRRLATLMLAVVAAIMAMAAIPPAPSPPRLVNDLAGVLHDVQAMEDTLVMVDNDTGNQIVVVTVASLDDLEPWDYAYQLGRKWGVGQKGTNNGVVILIKPKTPSSNGRAFIAPGYGLEGALPDALCTHVVNSEMIPHFKDGDYEAGVWAALHAIIPIVEGEYTAEQYLQQHGDDDDDEVSIFVVLMVIVFIAIVVIILSRYGDGGDGNNSGTGTWGGPVYWGGGSRGSSSWGGGSSSWGGSSWGGSSWGGGGFGGFGGGSFGGGGGGGSW